MTNQLPHLEPVAEGFRIRLRYGKAKQARFLIPLLDKTAASNRAIALRDLSSAIRKMPAEEARIVLSAAADAKSDTVFQAIVKTTEMEFAPKKPRRAPVTFAQLAEEWTSGTLHRKFPDHVPTKKTADLDEQRFATLNKQIGRIPLAQFSIEDADRAMAALPTWLAPARDHRS